MGKLRKKGVYKSSLFARKGHVFNITAWEVEPDSITVAIGILIVQWYREGGTFNFLTRASSVTPPQFSLKVSLGPKSRSPAS
jgi:hypothetical protein